MHDIEEETHTRKSTSEKTLPGQLLNENLLRPNTVKSTNDRKE